MRTLKNIHSCVGSLTAATGGNEVSKMKPRGCDFIRGMRVHDGLTLFVTDCWGQIVSFAIKSLSLCAARIQRGLLGWSQVEDREEVSGLREVPLASVQSHSTWLQVARVSVSSSASLRDLEQVPTILRCSKEDFLAHRTIIGGYLLCGSLLEIRRKMHRDV